MFNNTGNEYAYVGMNIPISRANINSTGLMLNQRVKFTSKQGLAVVSTANSNLDGSGTVTTIFSAGGTGAFIKRILVKAQGTVTQGTVRIFVTKSISTRLLREVSIPEVTQSSRDETMIAEITDTFYLESGCTIKASTENAETFIVSVEGEQLGYPR